MPKLLFLADVYGPSSPHVGDEAMLEANVSLFRRLLPGCDIDVAAGPGWDGIRLGGKGAPANGIARPTRFPVVQSVDAAGRSQMV